MPRDGKVYGIKTWRRWCESQPDYMGDQKQRPAEIGDEYICDVHTYQEMLRIVAFLKVMNKGVDLLYRGQAHDLSPTPTLLRDNWMVPGLGTRVELSLDRRYYYDQLAPLSARVCSVLRNDLPRHRPFELHASNARLRIAPWAVIQHYELWPTPLLDLTSSLRVAASFALALPTRRTEGYVYLYAIPGVISDLMELAGVPDPITYRLSAVCPPSAERPHLQEGFLIGRSLFNEVDLDARRDQLLAESFVAKFRLHDSPRWRRSTFWNRDFPRQRCGSFLPTATNDHLYRRLSSGIRHGLAEGRAIWR